MFADSSRNQFLQLTSRVLFNCPMFPFNAFLYSININVFMMYTLSLHYRININTFSCNARISSCTFTYLQLYINVSQENQIQFHYAFVVKIWVAVYDCTEKPNAISKGALHGKKCSYYFQIQTVRLLTNTFI